MIGRRERGWLPCTYHLKTDTKNLLICGLNASPSHSDTKGQHCATLASSVAYNTVYSAVWLTSIFCVVQLTKLWDAQSAVLNSRHKTQMKNDFLSARVQGVLKKPLHPCIFQTDIKKSKKIKEAIYFLKASDNAFFRIQFNLHNAKFEEKIWENTCKGTVSFSERGLLPLRWGQTTLFHHQL